jgi:segregation and condensation protein B
MEEASEAMAVSGPDEPASTPGEPAPGKSESEQFQGEEPAAVEEAALPERADRGEGGPGVDDIAPPENEAISDRLERIIESVLFAASAPVSLRRLVEILDGPSSKEVLAAVRRLLQEYAPGRHGIQLREVAGGYQFRTARENAEWVRAVFREKPARLGRAALETLAIVAYKQPVTRAEIEAVRGVDVEGVLSTLLSRRLIKIEGRKETVGRPLLYGTTAEFLEVFGLKDLNELPSLKELGPAPDTDDEATIPDAEQQTAAANEAVEVTAEVALDPGTFAASDAAPAEAPQPSGDLVAAEGGGVDSSGSGTPEWSGGGRAGNEGGPADGSDHG